MPQRIQDLDEAGISREAEIHAMRFMGDQLSRMATNMDNMVGRVSDMSTDVALMKQKTQDHALLWQELNILKTRAAQQDGAFSLAKVMKEFGPWLVAIGAGIWALFVKK